ncbi:intraflagellar transport 80 -like protein [Brachionus plicatilis]|uniref:Intraflagellar transport 80-like protein n=1 Tax=Brachionus plicatilis TaxID=10195 RepID=A0A3M7QSK7_BRAPC|nr:intraflagellar transport 80 -like protein [Brachionus plicatilis]
MRFKLTIPKESKHSEPVNCVGWTTADEVYSIGDDHVINKSNLINNEVQKLSDLSSDLFPTDMHWFPKSIGGSKKVGVPDIFVIGSADGKFMILSKNGKIEKSVEAHTGACICIRWSYDGTMIVTGGEDGQVKLWSKSGMLRSSLSQANGPIYSVAWSADNDSVLFCSGKTLTIKPLSASSKQNTWKAHDGIILKCDWNPVNNLIISGGEDCRYKLWDSYGRQLYSSYMHEYPITCLNWAPDGELFAVGSYNTLRLADKLGWSYSLEKPNIGSVFSMSWSSDSTQIACGCGSGQLVVGNLIERRLEWRHFEITLADSKQIKVRNCENDAKEELDLKDRVIKMSAGFGYLIVITPTQCNIYSVKSFNTPAITELKEASVTLIVQSEKYFLLIDGAGLYVYSYDGRLVSTPKWPAMRTEILNINTVSLSDDTIAVRDSDHKNVYFFEINGKLIGDGKPMTHMNEIAELALDQAGNANERKLAFVDKNRDLFLSNVRVIGSNRKINKLGGNIQNFVWNDAYNMLAGIADARFTIWYYPNIVYVDKNLLQRSIYQRDSSEFGKNPSLVSFLGNHVTMRTSDGSNIHSVIPPYASVLLAYISSNKWEEALKLCRFVKDQSLWTILAGAAIYNKDLDTASHAYAALNEIDKVEYIEYIKESPNKDIRNAETALLCGNFQDAEAILLQSNLIFRAIMLNLYQYNWERALELAVKYQNYIEIVIGFRQRYLEEYEKKETIKMFLKYRKEVDVDMDLISAMIEKEFIKERERPSESNALAKKY